MLVDGEETLAPSGERLLLSEQIRLALADDITSGILKPGEPLDEQQIARRFAASRTPVREALRELSVAGLVEVRPRRGAVVSRVTSERVMDMFEMTAEMEAMCVRLATYRMTPLERCRLQQMHDSSAEMVERGDFAAYDAFNWEFHQSIYRATHNDYMAEQAAELRTRMAAFRRAQLRYSGRLIRSRNEHDALMVAIARGDGEEAARLMRAHLLNASSALEQYLTGVNG